MRRSLEAAPQGCQVVRCRRKFTNCGRPATSSASAARRASLSLLISCATVLTTPALLPAPALFRFLLTSPPHRAQWPYVASALDHGSYRNPLASFSCNCHRRRRSRFRGRRPRALAPTCAIHHHSRALPAGAAGWSEASAFTRILGPYRPHLRQLARPARPATLGLVRVPVRRPDR
jgi:hypothetical protein